MNRLFLFGLALSLLAGSCRRDTNEGPFRTIRLEYPYAYQDTAVVDNYHGLRVSDPYRWLEKESDPMTRRWKKEEQSLTRQYLDNMPGRTALRQRLRELWNHQRFSSPRRHGKFYYLFKNDGLQDQDVLCRIGDPYDTSTEKVLDPNELAGASGAFLTDLSFSRDGSLLAFQLEWPDSLRRVVRILNLESGRLLADSLSGIRFSNLAWLQDGFFYSRYPDPPPGATEPGASKFHSIYYHRVGTGQEEDPLIFADRAFPFRNFYPTVTDDLHYLLLEAFRSGQGNALYLADLREDPLVFTELVSDFDHLFRSVGRLDNRLLFLTTYQAPNGRLLLIDPRRPAERNWRELVPEDTDVLVSVQLAGGKIVLTYIQNAAHQLRIFDGKGNLEGAVPLPGAGTVTDLRGTPEGDYAYFSFSSFTCPASLYELDLQKRTATPYRTPDVVFDTAAYETRQVWYDSYDGARIPMFIVHKKGLSLDGQRPTLLYGHGGGSVSLLPQFNLTGRHLFPVFLENDGVCVVVNLRGGATFGQRWRQAGSRQDRQQAFNDFQSAADYLIANRYTSPDKLAIHGRSDGGMLVGACLVQRPELYAVALPASGLQDMLRYQHLGTGWMRTADYGNSDDPEAFDYLYAYSPVHTAVPNRYPATLITTGGTEEEVDPAHSLKFAATLQGNQKGEAPVLVRIGEGTDQTTTGKIEEAIDLLSFTLFNLREEVKSPPQNE